MRRFRATPIDNQFAQFPAAGGATVGCTARSSADKGVVMELSIQDSELFPPANVEGAPDRKASQFRSTLTIPPGTTVIAAEIEPGAVKGPARIVILVSADVILNLKSP